MVEDEVANCVVWCISKNSNTRPLEGCRKCYKDLQNKNNEIDLRRAETHCPQGFSACKTLTLPRFNRPFPHAEDSELTRDIM